MTTALTMPKLSPTMTEGVLAKWHKQVGQKIEPGELLFEVATDKATIEYNALDGGWLRKILIEEGQKANVGDALALITDTADEKVSDIAPAAKAEAPKEAAKAESPKPVQKPEAIQAAPPQKAPIPPITAPTGQTLISPYAKKLAESEGLNFEGHRGTGPSGRIMSRDLDQIRNNQGAVAQKTTARGPSIPIEESFTPMRKVIAQRLQYSKSTIPHFYIRQLVDVTSLVHMREQLKASGISVTVNDLIVRATALSLQNHPNLRTTFDDSKNSILKHPFADISIAVTIEGGLITPIVFQADQKPLKTLSKEIRELAEKARNGKLQPQEYQGGCFTISNLGMFGTTDFLAIVNPPQCAILAVGAAAPYAFVKNGEVVPGQALMLTLSCDHRVVDGADAAKFMKELKETLENPFKLLMD